jgi:uncharacterized protein YbjT (DUF2867 family)
VTGRTAVLAGATGLVGGECLRQLLASDRYDSVIVVARRALDRSVRHPKLRELTLEFDRLGGLEGRLRGEHVFCALGTTIARAGSKARFRVVDHDYPLHLARLARAGGATHFSIVSALGASRSSPFFYSRVKGEVEQALRQMDWPSLAIFRPSIITGERSESRPLERLGEHLLRLAPAAWRPVAAADIASAMIEVALRAPPGTTIVESRGIPARARPVHGAESRSSRAGP